MTQPNMPEENLKRAESVLATIREYGSGYEEEETALKDVLTDSMHLANAMGWDFSALLRKAEYNYLADSKCCMCLVNLTSEDFAVDADNLCQKCMATLKEGQVIPSRWTFERASMIPMVFVLTTAHGDVLDAAVVSNVAEGEIQEVEAFAREKFNQNLVTLELKKFVSKEEMLEWVKKANAGGTESLDQQHMEES